MFLRTQELILPMHLSFNWSGTFTMARHTVENNEVKYLKNALVNITNGKLINDKPTPSECEPSVVIISNLFIQKLGNSYGYMPVFSGVVQHEIWRAERADFFKNFLELFVDFFKLGGNTVKII